MNDEDSVDVISDLEENELNETNKVLQDEQNIHDNDDKNSKSVSKSPSKKRGQRITISSRKSEMLPATPSSTPSIFISNLEVIFFFLNLKKTIWYNCFYIFVICYCWFENFNLLFFFFRDLETAFLTYLMRNTPVIGK